MQRLTPVRGVIPSFSHSFDPTRFEPPSPPTAALLPPLFLYPPAAPASSSSAFVFPTGAATITTTTRFTSLSLFLSLPSSLPLSFLLSARRLPERSDVSTRWYELCKLPYVCCIAVSRARTWIFPLSASRRMKLGRGKSYTPQRLFIGLAVHPEDCEEEHWATAYRSGKRRQFACGNNDPIRPAATAAGD